ncbi:F-box protein CPR1-like [Euphorbia lathyris]|uniref:F-box protein CPR1-like n=1 Tax=Euphorbia lathyris TaxID=212925 RepID=UPI003313838F
MANLPQELINEMLLWLPVKSLLRFRCVCKSFCVIIESQSFINSHFKRSFENRIHRKLIDLGVHRTDNNGITIHALDFNEDFQQEVVLDKSFPSRPYPLFFSYCNGLVLLWIHKLSLWNPSTREYRILPALPVKRTGDLSFALGYDSTTDDFKAVIIISKSFCFSQVWIFELRSSCWRRIQDFPYVGYNSIKPGGNGDCFVDGALHFICRRSENNSIENNTSYMIVAFDVAKETFSVVHEAVQQTEGNPRRLNVVGGCLSVSVWNLTMKRQIDIYVRKKDGVAYTWTRLYFVTSPQFSNEAFRRFEDGRVAYSKEGDKVFLSSNGKLCSYDFKEKNFQEILTTNAIHLGLFSYTESLMSVGS